MKRLRIILQYNLTYYILIVFTLLFIWFSTCFVKYHSEYDISDNKFEGVIQDYNIDGDYLYIELKAEEKLSGSYFFKSLEEKNEFIKVFKVGDVVKVEGSLVEPNSNTVVNQFNYRKYLYNNRQFFTINIDKIDKVSNSDNLLYKIKKVIINKIDSLDKSNGYIKAFILGDSDGIDPAVKQAYQNIGISHLFAVSGMHVTLLCSILLGLLKWFRLNNISKFLIIILFLYLYMFLTGFSASVLRASVFFILLLFNKLFKFNVKTINVLILALSIILLVNPFMIYNVGFLFSSIISIYLIVFSDLINRRYNYFLSLLVTSFVALVAGIPISIYNFFSFNYLSVVYNIIFVTLVTTIVFPLSIIVFIFPFFDNILFILIDFMEKLALFFDGFSTNLVFVRPSLGMCVVYYIVITLALYGLKIKHFGALICYAVILFFHYNYNFLVRNDYLLMIDVGQGDSLLYQSNNETFLIDTGGKVSFTKKYDWMKRKNIKSLTDNTLLPLFKSLGVRKISYLILTHGDYDHMGEAINLVENFKVEKVIFNCGEFGKLEQDLIKVLDKKKIPYYSCIKELNVDDNKLYFLNNKDYGNENDNSTVIYIELNNHKFLFMGDAGVEVEEDLIEKYNLQNIDVLKVGHHGSKTSSGKIFVDEIKPRYSIISVGKNNRYGHPNKEVLDNLEKSKIYRTDQDGSIMFKIKNNKLQMETCSP